MGEGASCLGIIIGGGNDTIPLSIIVQCSVSVCFGG